jgi:DNA-binding CsgD family transcriptional regulator
VGWSTAVITSRATELLERDEVLDQIERLADEVARTGSGRMLVIEGPAGIGKSALVAEVCPRLELAGVTVLRASGAELETALAYGVVRQLFAPVTAGKMRSSRLWRGAAALARPVVDPRAVADTKDVDPTAAMHGLWWLCVTLADQAPLVLVVDDAHWADLSSLRWISYLVRRTGDMPVLVIVSTRPVNADAAEAQILASMARNASSIVLPALSAAASASLIRRAVAPNVPDDVCRACFAATNGNPFYLNELVAEGGAALVTLDGAAVGEMAPERTVRAVVARLAALGREAKRLARAIAVLGAPVALLLSARLADLDIANAEVIADSLASAGLLLDRRPPQFAHPILRSAVYSDLPEGTRSALHRAAGRILHDSGADPTAVGAALLSTQPHADQAVVELLRAAASAARSRGDMHAAATYLNRALREPPAPGVLGDVLLELGTAERRMHVPQAVDHLRLALQAAEKPSDRVPIAFELARALNQPGDLAEALDVIAAVTSTVKGSPDLAALLEANRIGLGSLHLTGQPTDTGYAHELLTRIDTQTRPARLLRGALASDALYHGRSMSDIAPLLDAALAGDPHSFVGDINLSTYIAFTAMLCERLDDAERILDVALDRAQRAGSAAIAGQVWTFRSQVYMRLGRLREAEADARLAIEALQDLSLVAITPLPVDPLIERDQSADAVVLLRHVGLAGQLPPWLPSLVILARRIALWTAVGDVAAALADLDNAERLAEHVPGCAAIPWRAEGALACLAAGDRKRARTLAEQNLRLAEALGASGVRSTALRIAGIADGGPDRLELLGAAVDEVADTQLRLEHVKALAALGAAQRRTGQRTLARRTLTAGLDLAEACGAIAVANGIREELSIAGARQRRHHLDGAAALTASQLRISTLAAAGATNHEIAQALFLTPKTIERHLTNAYATLGIASRKDLAAALARVPHT